MQVALQTNSANNNNNQHENYLHQSIHKINSCFDKRNKKKPEKKLIFLLVRFQHKFKLIEHFSRIEDDFSRVFVHKKLFNLRDFRFLLLLFRFDFFGSPAGEWFFMWKTWTQFFLWIFSIFSGFYSSLLAIITNEMFVYQSNQRYWETYGDAKWNSIYNFNFIEIFSGGKQFLIQFEKIFIYLEPIFI